MDPMVIYDRKKALYATEKYLCLKSVRSSSDIETEIVIDKIDKDLQDDRTTKKPTTN